MRRIVPVLFCLLALYSCTEDNQSSQEKVTVQGTRVTEGRLAFRDVTHFSETLTRLQNDPGSASSILQGLSFKSLLHTIPDIEKFNSENYLLSLYSYQILLNHEK